MHCNVALFLRPFGLPFPDVSILKLGIYALQHTLGDLAAAKKQEVSILKLGIYALQHDRLGMRL